MGYCRIGGYYGWKQGQDDKDFFETFVIREQNYNSLVI